MKISAKTEYACAAMMELAARYASGELVQIRRIADQHGIPSRFLVQILLQLKGAGLVSSTRGAAGGYQLARSPQDISLGEVVEVIEGPQDRACFGGDTAAARVLQQTWQQVTGDLRKRLRAITLAELIEQVQEQQHMYYI